ncbi:MAG: exopolyphosphatase [Myxococcales bacterium]
MTQDPAMVAAVDLGSNSFHMVVARVSGEHLRFVDRLRERVALAEGLDSARELTPEARERALACLVRFGQRLRDFPQGTVRAVGTNTLRQVRNAEELLAKASDALGHPIEVISGREEARLIYLGVAHDVEWQSGNRLVVDIGGGSTEVIIGQRHEPIVADSLYMGCVTYSRRFFPDGTITRDALRQAEIAARRELQPIERRYRAVGWRRCLGASGTITAIDDILRATGWSEQGITATGLRKLRKAVLAAGHTGRLTLPGMPPDRAAILPGGLSVLTAVFESLGIEEMTAAHAALREGLLHDLLGRLRHEDVRDATVQRLVTRYEVDREQAARVRATTHLLLEVVAADWGLDDEARHFLGWAAQLHEIGLSVAWSGYHKHGAYLLQHADMPGFSREDQALLATLVLNHRRKLNRDRLASLPPRLLRPALRMSVLLRLAVVLNRARSARPLPPLTAQVRRDRLEVAFPPGWLEEHPMTREDLAAEAAVVAAAGIELALS